MRLSKRRKFINHKKRIMYFSLFFLLLFISVGYAYLNAALSINGHTELSANTWNIHFENLAVTDGSVAASTPAAIQSDTTNIVYSVLLDRPGDFYEFEVDVVNSGTIGGKISLVNIQGISSAAEPYLEHSIKYTNGNNVQVDDLLNPGARKRIVVRVGYKEDLNNLPEDDIDLDLELGMTYSQTDEEEITTDTIIQQLKTENSSCFTKYTGQVTDQVGQTVSANNVYFDKCADKRNIIFNNMCWQMIRTTETGGIKMLYNGEPDNDGHCITYREDHKGIIGTNGNTQLLNAEYLYGTSFTYNISTSEFTLTDTISATWSASTYENLIGKYTCKNTSGTCTTLYYVNVYSDNTSAYVSKYTIGDTNYAQIGTSPFNANIRSPAMVGYMFNKAYINNGKSPGTTEYKYGSSFTYDESTNMYTLSGITQNINDWSTGYSLISDTHYTCWNTTGTCNTISYITYTYNAPANGVGSYYFNISGGKGISDILTEMLSSNDVNRYNSSIKGMVDAWYAQNLSSKTNMLEDTIFCNARSIIDYGAWNPNGGIHNHSLNFKNYNYTTDLSCLNETDQFSLSNNKAKLTYPVGLISTEELYSLLENSLRKTGVNYWLLSPYIFNNTNPEVYYVSNKGYLLSDVNTSLVYGSRPAISLASGVQITSGTGSEADPWIVE